MGAGGGLRFQAALLRSLERESGQLPGDLRGQGGGGFGRWATVYGIVGDGERSLEIRDRPTDQQFAGSGRGQSGDRGRRWKCLLFWREGQIKGKRLGPPPR